MVFQDNCHITATLAFWLANASELLNLLKQDGQLAAVTEPEPQDTLAEAVHKAFAYLAACLRDDVMQSVPMMLEPSIDDAGASSGF